MFDGSSGALAEADSRRTLPFGGRYSPYWQIFLTYLRRPAFWITGAMFLLGISFFIRGSGAGRAPPATACFLYFFGYVVVQVKEQIASPRASVIPGYRVPHLVVAGLLAGPTIFMAPPAVAMAMHLPLLPVVSAAIAFGALVAWAIYLGNYWAAIAVGLWFSTLIPAVRQFCAGLFAGQFRVLSGILFAGSSVGFAFLVRRMLKLTEEMTEYARITSFAGRRGYSGRFSVTKTVPASWYRNRWLQWMNQPGEIAQGRVVHGGGLPLWRRVLRRSALEGAGRSLHLLAILVMVAVIMASSRAGRGWGAEGSTLISGAWLTLLFQALIVGTGATRRWPLLGYESLLPLTRGQLLLEHAATLAWEIARIWLVFVLIAVGAAALFSTPLLRGPAFWMVLAAAGALQILIYAVGIWILRMRSMWLSGLIVGAFFGALIPLEAVFTGKFTQLSAGVVALALFGVLAVAAIIFADAGRRWMRTDLA